MSSFIYCKIFVTKFCYLLLPERANARFHVLNTSEVYSLSPRPLINRFRSVYQALLKSLPCQYLFEAMRPKFSPQELLRTTGSAPNSNRSTAASNKTLYCGSSSSRQEEFEEGAVSLKSSCSCECEPWQHWKMGSWRRVSHNPLSRHRWSEAFVSGGNESSRDRGEVLIRSTA